MKHYRSVWQCDCPDDYYDQFESSEDKDDYYEESDNEDSYDEPLTEYEKYVNENF